MAVLPTLDLRRVRGSLSRHDLETLDAYMRDVRRHPLLSPEAERRLAQRAQAGDERSRQQLILSNLRLVVRVALRFAGRGVPLADLIQEGNVGLIRAVRSFDSRKGHRFGTYAIWWVFEAVSRHAHAQARAVQLPIHLLRRRRLLEEAETRLTQALRREPDVTQLAETLGWKRETVESLLLWQASALSLEGEVGDGDTMLKDMLVKADTPDPEEQALQSIVRDELYRVLGCLTPQQRIVVCLRYGLGDGESEHWRRSAACWGSARKGFGRFSSGRSCV